MNELIDYLLKIGAKGSPTSFSPVTSRKVGISPQNILIFRVNSFATPV